MKKINECSWKTIYIAWRPQWLQDAQSLCPECEEGQHGCTSSESTVAAAVNILVTVYKDNYTVSLNDK